MNTISLTPGIDNIIPVGSTVVIKQGTKIIAHENSSLIVQGTLIAEGTEKHPITFFGDIGGAEKGYWQGITVSNHGIASFKNCTVKDAEIAILAEDNSNVSVTGCTIENNITGIGAFNSEPYIKENHITNNDKGIGSYKNGSPVLSDIKNETPFRNAVLDNSECIYINNANIYLDYGFNDIFNTPAAGYYIRISTESAQTEVFARNNYWGSTDLTQINKHIEPSEAVAIEPILTSPQTVYSPPGGSEKDLLKNAETDKENGDYQSAENTYKTIIEQYPASEEAYMSVSGLFECRKAANGNMHDLETYFNGLYNDTTLSEAFHKLTFGYINLCKRSQAKFSEAIANYESIIQNNPTYNDSVFAVIDIGNTYEEAGNYKSTLGTLSYLVPVSRAKHVEKTVDLLLSLHPENQIPEITGGDFVLKQNIPNPFDKTTVISYTLPRSCRVSFDVFDVTGKKVYDMNTGTQNKGKHKVTLDLSGFSPGVYYYLLKADNESAGVGKMILK